MKPKPRKCRKCKTSFAPRNSMQVACGPLCALALARAAKERSETARKRLSRRAGRLALEAMKSLPELTRECQTAFNAWVRERDYGLPCICCGKQSDDDGLITGSRWDAGHYRSVGSARHLRFHPDNCHRQRVICNRHGQGRHVEYRQGLIARIGLERVEALEADNGTVKWSRDDLRAMRDKYRAMARELKKRRERRDGLA